MANKSTHDDDNPVPMQSDERKYFCSLCPRKFKSIKARSVHERIHKRTHEKLEKGKKRYKCNLCNTAFSTGSGLKRHHKIHTSPGQATCNTCNKRFSRKDSLRYHKLLMHDHRQKVVCPKPGCGKEYPQIKLGLHIKTCGKTNVCPHCDRPYVDLRKHIETQHVNKGKRYACEKCDRTYVSMRRLKEHIPIHCGQEISCETCGKKYKLRSSLLTHMASHRKGRVR